MRKIYYPAGPEAITAGIAGMFRVGRYKLVPDWLAEQLLKKEMFKEVGRKEDIPLDELADPDEFAGRENPPAPESKQEPPAVITDEEKPAEPSS